jgi:hypothetical protein
VDSISEISDLDWIEEEDGDASPEEEEDYLISEEEEKERLREDEYVEIFRMWRLRQDRDSSSTLIRCLQRRLSGHVGLGEEVVEAFVKFMGPKEVEWRIVAVELARFLESFSQRNLCDIGEISSRYAAAVNLAIDLLLRHGGNDIGTQAVGALFNLSLMDRNLMDELTGEYPQRLFERLEQILEGVSLCRKQSVYLLMRIAKTHRLMTVEVVAGTLPVIATDGQGQRVLRLECLWVLLNGFPELVVEAW